MNNAKVSSIAAIFNCNSYGKSYNFKYSKNCI